jgi:hypothetical protein
LEILGYKFGSWQDDPTTYLVAWVIVTLFLIALATKYGATAVGFALTAFFGVVLWTQHDKLAITGGGGKRV